MMDKVDLMTVLALSMCGLALFSVLVVYHATRLLIELKSPFGKIFAGLVTAGALLLAVAALSYAATLSGFSSVWAARAGVVGLCFVGMAIAAVCAEADARSNAQASVKAVG